MPDRNLIHIAVVFGFVWSSNAASNTPLYLNSSTTSTTSSASSASLTSLTSLSPLASPIPPLLSGIPVLDASLRVLDSILNSATPTPTPGEITSCPSVPEVRSLLPRSFHELPKDQQRPFLLSYFTKFAGLRSDIGEILAEPTASNKAAEASISSRNNEIFSIVQSDISVLFGDVGQAVLSFDGFTDPCLYQTCLTQFYNATSSFYSPAPTRTNSFIYTPAEPCCGRCTVYGSGVELEYWPTPAPNPPVSTLIDTAQNITYISPSVYVRFTSLNARNRCSQVGRMIDFTRIPFDPNRLSTSYLLGDKKFLSLRSGLQPPNLGQFTQINYADFDSPKCLCAPNCPFNTNLGRTDTILCKPQIAIPQEVTALDPAWAACAPDLFGIFDPPIALPRAEGLTGPRPTPAVTTSAAPVVLPTATEPGPANSPISPISPPTSAPLVIEPVKTDPQAPGRGSSLNPVGPTGQVEEPSNPVRPTGQVEEPSNPDATAGTSAGAVVINSVPPTIPTETQPAFQNPVPPASPTIVIGTQTFTLGSLPSTLTSGGSTIVVGPTGVAVIVDGSTSLLAGASTLTAVPKPNIITINGEVLTANPNDAFVIGTQTLTPGGAAITVSGTVISIAEGATKLVVGTSTSQLGGLIASFVGVTGVPTKSVTTKAATNETTPRVFTGAASRGGVDVRFVVLLAAMGALIFDL